MNICEKFNDKKFLNISIVFVLVTLNIIIKSIYLTDYNIDLDEPFSLFHSQKPLSELFKIFTWENNPPLFFVILHFWIKLFGIDVVSARILPMIFSSLAVLFIYKIGYRFLNLSVAIGASLLYTFSNLNITEAHDCRVYSLFVLLTVASMYFYFALFEAENKKIYLIALTITNILLIYAHFLAFFVVLLQAFYSLAISSFRKKNLKGYLISSLFIFLAYLPYLYLFLLRFSQTMKTGINSPPLNLYSLYSSFINAFTNNFLAGSNYLIILVVFIIYTIFRRFKFSIYEKMIFGWFGLVYLILFLISLKIQIIGINRYLIFITPGFFLTLMIGIYYLSKSSKFLSFVLLPFYVSLMLISSNPKSSHGLESSKAVSYIQKHKSDSTFVFIVPKWVDIVFTYHYNIDIFKDYEHYEKLLAKDNIYTLSSALDINMSRLSAASDVYLLDGWNGMALIDPNYSILSSLASKFGEVDSVAVFNKYTVYHFKNKKHIYDTVP